MLVSCLKISANKLQKGVLVYSYMVAVGNASLALATRESGAGAPPNKRPSSGCPTKVLKVRSVTMDGTPPATPTFSCLINLVFKKNGVSFKINLH